MNHAMLECGVCYCQSMASTEVQQQSTTQVQIRQAVPPDHPPPGLSVIPHVSIEVPQQNYGVPRRYPFQDTTQQLQEEWVLRTAVRCINTNHGQSLLPSDLQSHRGDPLIHRGELQHSATQLGAIRRSPYTLGITHHLKSCCQQRICQCSSS